MTIHVRDVQWYRENTNINLVKKIEKHSTMCILIVIIWLQTSIVENHLCFEEYITVSSVAVYITVDKYSYMVT